MNEFWKFAQLNPGFAFFGWFLFCYALTRPFKYAHQAYKAKLRSKNIQANGWPSPPMDADGDIILPEKE